MRDVHIATPSPQRATAIRGLPNDPRRGAPLEDSVGRLTRVAETAYASKEFLPLGQGVLGIEHDYTFPVVIGLVYRELPSLEERWEAYRRDYGRLTAAVAAKALEWLPKALAMNRDAIARFEETVAIPEIFAKLHAAAARFDAVLERRRDEYTDYVETPRGFRRVERPEQRLKVERDALDVADNRELRILFGHPDRRSLFGDLARDEATARGALAELFRDAYAAIAEFGADLRKDPERFWRYPPIVLAAFGELRVAASADFARYLLDVARLRAREWWELPLSVAGTALAAVGLVLTGGWGAVVLGLLDLGVSGFSTVETYLAARENEVAGRAGAFGQKLTDRPTSYGPVALEAASAIVAGVAVGFGTLQVFHEAAEAKKAAQAAEILPSPNALDGPAIAATAATDAERGAAGRGLAEPGTLRDDTTDIAGLLDREVGGRPADGFAGDLEPLEAAALDEAPGETSAGVFERLTDNRVGAVDTEALADLQRPKGGKRARGFASTVEPVDAKALHDRGRRTANGKLKDLEPNTVRQAESRGTLRRGTQAPGTADPPQLIGTNVHLNGDTAGTGGIKRITGSRAPDGSLTVTISGELRPSLNRKSPSTPNFNKELITGSEIGLPDYEIAHLWGPGFGDEARDGLMYAPREVNQVLQNRGVEGRLRDLEKLARAQGATIEVTARATSRPLKTWKGHEILEHATYRFEVRLRDGTRLRVGEVDIRVPAPGSAGRPTVDIRAGSAQVWSLT